MQDILLMYNNYSEKFVELETKIDHLLYKLNV